MLDHDAEASMLGRLIGDGDLVTQALGDGVNAETFTRAEHVTVFRALTRLRPEDHEGGVTALMHCLRRTDELALAGGTVGLASLLEAGFASAKNARWTWRRILIP